MDIDAASHFIIKVAQPGLVFRTFLNKHISADELRHVINHSLAAMLDQHLIGLVDGTTMQHLGLVLGSDWNLARQHINLTFLEHFQQCRHAASHLKAQSDAMGTSKVTDAVIIIAHRIPLEDEKACGTVERTHGKRIGQLMLVL